MRVTDLAPVAIIFVIAGIALGIGANVLENISTGVTAGSIAQSAVNNTTMGIYKVAGWLPTIGLVIAAAIIIGVVFSSFAMGGGRQ